MKIKVNGEIEITEGVTNEKILDEILENQKIIINLLKDVDLNNKIESSNNTKTSEKPEFNLELNSLGAFSEVEKEIHETIVDLDHENIYKDFRKGVRLDELVQKYQYSADSIIAIIYNIRNRLIRDKNLEARVLHRYEKNEDIDETLSDLDIDVDVYAHLVSIPYEELIRRINNKKGRSSIRKPRRELSNEERLAIYKAYHIDKKSSQQLSIVYNLSLSGVYRIVKPSASQNTPKHFIELLKANNLNYHAT